ncbi:calpain-1 catalytic subunit [Festucalex cinctus]
MPAPGACLNILEARHKQGDCGSFDQSFLSQNFQQLKQYCLVQRVRYIDEKFPPDRNSIGAGLLRPSDLDKVVWLRPAKISHNPSFIMSGVSRFDFGQGMLGNCWFLASIGALTFQNDILKKVVPFEQTFDEDYCGLFHFRFWRFGTWVDVVIDDKLPTLDGRLIFVHSKNKNEFWPALLEKAYAKVCGSYVDMRVGTPSEAMMDFTGGVHMCIQLSQAPAHLWELMCRAGNSKTLMGCGTPQGEMPESYVSKNGLVQGHAYTITGVKQLMSSGQIVRLVRLWNPWGKVEWNGDWSDRSPLWNTVSDTDRQMTLKARDDGEFWMTLEDLCKFFVDLDICSPFPDFLDGSSIDQWKISSYEGRWVAGTTAGGCMNNREGFWTNPQYRIKITNEESMKTGQNNTVVSLIQKADKRYRRLVKNLHIGFNVFEVTEKYKQHRGKFPAAFFSSQAAVAQTKMHLNGRDVMEFILLKPGEYVIVPSTFNPNGSASFILTIYSKMDILGYENSQEHRYEPHEKVPNIQDDENKKLFFRQYSDKHEEVDAEQLQILLNENILKGDLKSGGFSIDACRSMVALMDTSITGRLNSEEFVRLWKKVVIYKDIFYQTDVSQTGKLSLSELRNAIRASGMNVGDDMLNLMALRYGASSGHMTLENFISLILRLECMNKIFQKLSDGNTMYLQKSEFWRFGRWVDVVIDDKLPTLNGNLIFVRSKDPTEFWPALLEKAYAKVCGSYSDMSSGTPNEALVDFTGGVHICIDLSDPPQDLWELMCRAGQSMSLMGCGTPQGETPANTVLPNGLVQGHAYTVTGVKQMMSRGQPVYLVRLLNPWGKGEWNGDWSDRSPLWETVSPQDRALCLSVVENGEFWMSLGEFCRFYNDLDICCLCPDFLDENSSCHWKTSFYEGRWLAGKTAGGCMNEQSFWTNPQYRVRIDQVHSECVSKQGERNMLVSLMQKPDKRNRALVKTLHIGFSVFEVPQELKAQREMFPASFFSTNKPVVQTKNYINAREVMELVMLRPGDYLIVPATFKPNETASFILTIVSKAEAHIHETSGGHSYGRKDSAVETDADDDRRILFRQLFDKYDEVDAELLQKLLNDKVLKGDLKTGGFSIDACRSMVVMMSTTTNGKLNAGELYSLWKKVVTFKDLFLRTDVSTNGSLSLIELKNAVVTLGIRVSDYMLNVLAVRYGTSSGHVTMENFITLALRLVCMKKIFKRFSDGMTLTLPESEWMQLSMST